MKLTVKIQVGNESFPGIEEALERVNQHFGQGVEVQMDAGDIDLFAKAILEEIGEAVNTFVDAPILGKIRTLLGYCEPQYRYAVDNEPVGDLHIVESFVGYDHTIKLVSDDWRGDIAYRVYRRGEFVAQVDFADDVPYVSDREFVE